MKEIRVIVKKPNQAPKEEIIDNTLEAFQELVGGDIETFTFALDAVIVVNDMGRLNGMPFNTDFLSRKWYGNMVFVGTKNDEFTDFPLDLEDFKLCIPRFWREQE